MWSSRALRRVALTATAALALTGLVACGGDDDSGDKGDAAVEKKITIGYMAWDEAVAASYLWSDLLQKQGFEVDLKNVEAGVVYQGLAAGDIDLFLDGWLPQTHASYWERYSDDLEKIGVWYDNASLSIAVPQYVTGVDSLADLAGNADTFDGEIIGIEPGAGLTAATQDKVIPEYGMTGKLDLKTSSTPAMLAALDGAIKDEKPIVVTLWHPHWAYAKYQLKDLADPKGTLGQAEEITTLARKGFSADFPEATEMLKKFTMSDDQLGSLEDLMFNVHADNEEKAVEEWLKANPDFATSLGATS
ncbi:glycine betaine ABC transporter substrate-binding protein [Salinispora arenicola]|uniref:glycine betaine ABC transporter substrate-binding protein n=1 Tax=Salinispora arenicola TaxID=168697 RepID=UPI0016A62DBD|nr:glycine betaine ABC transporter substrate-binding protein [Salinispora arenicola]NIL56291.1 glycine betaine ABC transporter substrate-binding protein [Salinispora arenicola]NIL60267.1 glycine betaine ABC transporter substrate-binding protein [Salinispora arenicola]